MPIETPQTAIPTSNETIPYGEQEVFFSYNGEPVLRPGQVVTYERVRGPGGEWKAINIEIVKDVTVN
ncbi:hypothetical protein [Pseudomonas rhodesiae]|uniref:hypothetical protein n=1 Tax=Pseudomonas rhodesiae TaxID=76760 RepID=UPI00241DB914|nr:hypothetical protein [Pseudomonas rhodesiae]